MGLLVPAGLAYTGGVIEVRAFALGLVFSIAVVYVLLLIVVSRLDREPGFWALQAGSLTGFFGVLLVMLQGALPPFPALVGGNGLALFAMVFFAHGLSQWIAQRSLPRAIWLLPVLMMLVAWWFGVVDRQIGPRILAFNALFLIVSTGLGIFLWRQASGSVLSRSLRWLALVCFWLSAMAVTRSLVWLLLGIPEHSLLDSSWQHVVPYMGQLAGLVLLVMLITALLVSNLVERLRRQASLDPLTQLLNRQGLRDRLQVWLHGETPAPNSCALMMLDLDRFKQINDQHGHEVGDLVLSRLADIMRSQVGPDDLPIRLGGEEFALLSFSPDPRAQAEAIRRSFAEGPTELPACTVSIGLIPRIELSAEAVRAAFKRADEALYLAKRNGRNRVELIAL